METLSEVLEKHTVEGSLFENLDGNRVRCFACGHRCRISDGASGICKVRFNRGGELRVPFGYVAGMQCDPIEKKPFFHARPGARAFSFGMMGCNFHCSYCQNWVTSQVLRDPHAVMLPRETTPEQIVSAAVSQRADVIVSTYNEPLITSEWAVAVFKSAKAAGLMTAYVSNGNGTPEVIEYLRPWVDLFKVDLKSFDDRKYRQLGGHLDSIRETVRKLAENGTWLEIVTLLVPGFNDSSAELLKLAEFIASVSASIPWHVTAFHRDYQMTDPDDCTAEDLHRAADIGRGAGLQFVYAGNLPGRVRNLENTCCPGCGTVLIERQGYQILSNRMLPGGHCPTCNQAIPGRWSS